MKLKKYFLLLLILEIFFSYAPAFAQELPPYNYAENAGVSEQIKKYLCAPKDPEKSQTQTDILDSQGNPITFDPNQAAFNNTNSSVLYECINRLYKFAIILACVVGVFFIVIAGYVYMAAEGNQESVDKAKNILTTTITSIVILLAGFVLLKAINPDLVEFHSIQPPGIKIGDLKLPEDTIGQQPPYEPVGGVCKDEKVSNICEGVTGGCTQNVCSGYSSAVAAAAAKFPITGADTQALIKSIMYNESSRGRNLESPAGACGIMQLLPDTADRLKGYCGVATKIDCAWLKNPANFDKSICIGAAYLKNLSEGACSSNNESNLVRNLAAGYNGGSKACEASVSCGGEAGCAAQPMRKWECTWDNTERTQCNTGYLETRSYAPKVLGCYQLNK